MKIARVAVPDFVSNSYFPAMAAMALDCFQKEGLEVRRELIFPNYKAFEALRDGDVDFVAGPAHALLPVFPEWRGAKLLAALSQGMFWMLVMRADLKAHPGDVNAVKGRRIGAAPLVDLALRQLLIDAGIDLEADGVEIVGVPGAHEPGVSFGVVAAKALQEGALDGFWANAMGAENAVRSGVGEIVLDVRRGLGPAKAFHYTMPALVTSNRLIETDPELAAGGLRAVLAAQRALRADASLATVVGRRLFPPAEAELIGAVVARDLPYYTPEISDESLAGMIGFAQAAGLLKGTPARDQIVATGFSRLWAEP